MDVRTLKISIGETLIFTIIQILWMCFVVVVGGGGGGGDDPINVEKS